MTAVGASAPTALPRYEHLSASGHGLIPLHFAFIYIEIKGGEMYEKDFNKKGRGSIFFIS